MQLSSRLKVSAHESSKLDMAAQCRNREVSEVYVGDARTPDTSHRLLIYQGEAKLQRERFIDHALLRSRIDQCRNDLWRDWGWCRRESDRRGQTN